MERSKALSELDNLLFNEINKDDPSEDEIRKLVSRSANVNAITSYDDSILSNAVINVRNNKDLWVVKLLIELGADPNINTCEGFNCLFDACIIQEYDLIKFLLESGADPNCISEHDEINY